MVAGLTRYYCTGTQLSTEPARQNLHVVYHATGTGSANAHYVSFRSLNHLTCQTKKSAEVPSVLDGDYDARPGQIWALRGEGFDGSRGYRSVPEQKKMITSRITLF
jgi:hypothetical protein